MQSSGSQRDHPQTAGFPGKNPGSQVSTKADLIGERFLQLTRSKKHERWTKSQRRENCLYSAKISRALWLVGFFRLA